MFSYSSRKSMHRTSDDVPLMGGLKSDPLRTEPHLGDCTRYNTCCSFSSRCSPPATMIAEAVFLHVCIIRMSRTTTVAQSIVILGVVVSVVNHKGDRSAKCLSIKETAKPFHLIGFSALSGIRRRSVALPSTL